MGVLQDIAEWLKGLGRRSEEPQLDAEQMMTELTERPTPTVWDVLYEVTGKPTFKAIADFVRPQPEDTGGMVGPLATGEMSVHVAKQLPKLLRAYYAQRKLSARPEIEHLIKEEVPTAVGLPEAPLASADVVSRLADNIGTFIKTLADLPRGALSNVEKAWFVPRYLSATRRLSGGYYPEDKTIAFFGGEDIPAERALRVIPRVLAHEATHAAVGKESLYKDVLDFLSTVKWKFEKPTLRKRLAELATAAFGRPTAYVPAYSANVKYVPRTYKELSSLEYEPGNPTWPRAGWPSVMPPREWGQYALSHPIEDVAESGAFSMLDVMPPEYFQRYVAEIEALRQNPRYEAIKQLLRKAGVELP